MKRTLRPLLRRLKPAAKTCLVRLRQWMAALRPRQGKLVVSAGGWDEVWLREQYAQVAPSLRTYLRGRLPVPRGFWPNPLFDHDFYLETNPDVAVAGVPPLLHYLTCGFQEGRSPNRLLNERWYRQQYADVRKQRLSALQHYAKFGERECRQPHPLFDPKHYSQQFSAVDISAYGTFLAHYLHCGETQGAKPHPLFDPVHYAQQRGKTPNLPAIQRSLVADYCSHGAPAHISPSAEFDDLCRSGLVTETELASTNPLIAYLIRSGQTSTVEHCTADRWLGLFGRVHPSDLARWRAETSGPPAHFIKLMVVGQPDLYLTLNDIASGFSVGRLDVMSQAAWEESEDRAMICLSNPGVVLRWDAVEVALGWLQNNPRKVVYLDHCIAAEGGSARRPVLLPEYSRGLFASDRGLSPVAVLGRAAPGSLSNPLIEEFCSFWAQQGPLPKQTPAKPICRLPLIGADVQSRPGIGASNSSSVKSSTALSSSPSPPQPLVTVIVPTRDRADLLRPCIRSLLQNTAYANLDCLIIDNGSVEDATFTLFRELDADPRVCIQPADIPFNFSTLCNIGVRAAGGSLVCLLNNDILVSPAQSDWLQLLVDEIEANEADVAGAMLLYPGGRVQSAGVLMGPGGVAANRYCGRQPDSLPEQHRQFAHEVAAVAGACLLTRKDLYQRLGGLNEADLGVAFNDVDFCLRVDEAGGDVRLVPKAQLVHQESASLKSHVGGREKDFSREVQYMKSRWHHVIAQDPYHHPGMRVDARNPDEIGLWNPAHHWIKSVLPPSSAPLSWRNWHPPLHPYAEHNPERAILAQQQVPDYTSHLTGADDTLGVLIVTKDRPEYIIPLLQDLFSARPRLEAEGIGLRILLADTGTTEPSVLKFYAEHARDIEVSMGCRYHFSENNNFLIQKLETERWILFLNNDIRFESPAASLMEMLESLRENPEVGAVGPVLFYPDGTCQHEGIAPILQSELRGFVHHPNNRKPTSMVPGQRKDCLAVTGACLLTSSESLRSTNGFVVQYAKECQDVDLCLRFHQNGYTSRVVHAGRVTHYENGTRPSGEECWPDRQRFMRLWHGYIEQNWALNP